MPKPIAFFAATLFCLILLIGCGGGPDPADTVEAYMQALIDSDEDAIRSLICSEKEAEIEIQVLTFSTVSGAELDSLSCERVGDTDAVKCSGQIIAQYGAEETTFPLVTYRVVEEDGEWKWCGETS